MENEFKKRIEYIAKRLDVDADDLLAWYQNDKEDICEMDGKEILKIVKEYLNLKYYYLNHHHYQALD